MKFKEMELRMSELEEQLAVFFQIVDDVLEKVCAAVYGSLFCSQRVGTLRRFGL